MVKSVYEQLRRNPGALQQTIKHAHHLLSLDTVLREQLEPALAAHCQLANIRANTAVIQADSPVWAATLRYQTPVLLDILNAADITDTRLTHIQIRVQPAYQVYSGPTPTRPHLSPASAKLLQIVADTTPDPRLKRALSCLAQRSRPRT